MTNEIVQVRPCVTFGGIVDQCAVEEADFFGVYYGGPGARKWIADFDSLDDAINWATEVAMNEECPLDLTACAMEETQ